MIIYLFIAGLIIYYSNPNSINDMDDYEYLFGYKIGDKK